MGNQTTKPIETENNSDDHKLLLIMGNQTTKPIETENNSDDHKLPVDSFRRHGNLLSEWRNKKVGIDNFPYIWNIKPGKEMESFVKLYKDDELWNMICENNYMKEFKRILNKDRDMVVGEKTYWVPSLNLSKAFDIGNIFVKTKKEQTYLDGSVDPFEYTFMESIDNVIRYPNKSPKEQEEEFSCAKKLQLYFCNKVLTNYLKHEDIVGKCDQKVFQSITLTLENVWKKIQKGGKNYIGLELRKYSTWDGAKEVTPVRGFFSRNYKSTYYIIQNIYYADTTIELNFPDPQNSKVIQCRKAKFMNIPISFSLLTFECKNNVLGSPAGTIKAEGATPKFIFLKNMHFKMTDLKIVGVGAEFSKKREWRHYDIDYRKESKPDIVPMNNFPYNWHFEKGKEMKSFIELYESGKIWTKICRTKEMITFKIFLNADIDKVRNEKLCWVPKLNLGKLFNIGTIFVKTKNSLKNSPKEFTFMGFIDKVKRHPFPKKKAEKDKCANKVQFYFYDEKSDPEYLLEECDQKGIQSITLTLENMYKKLHLGGVNYIDLELTKFKTWEGATKVTPVSMTRMLASHVSRHDKYYIIHYIYYADVSIEGNFPHPQNPNIIQCRKAKFMKVPIAFSFLKFKCKNNKLMYPWAPTIIEDEMEPIFIYNAADFTYNMADLEIVGSSESVDEEIKTSNYSEMGNNQGRGLNKGKYGTSDGRKKNGSCFQCCNII